MTRADRYLYEAKRGILPVPRGEWDHEKKPYIPRWGGRPVPESPIIQHNGDCWRIHEDWHSDIINAFSVLLQSDSWSDTPNNQVSAFRQVSELLYLLLTGEFCAASPPSGGGGGSGQYLPDCIRIDEKGIHIWNCEKCDMGDIYIYNGCGCGCGGTGGNSGALLGGGSSGITGGSSDFLQAPVSPGAYTTRCDFITTVIPYIIAQADEFVTQVDLSLTGGASIGEALVNTVTDLPFIGNPFDEFIELFADLLALASDGFINVLTDADFILRAQETAWAVFTESRYTQVTRNEINTWANRLPNIWGTLSPVPIRIFMQAFARVINLDKVNTQLLIARGTGQTALCEYLASTNGETYTPPQAPLLPPSLTPGQRYPLTGYDLQLVRFENVTAPSNTNVPIGVTLATGERVVAAVIRPGSGQPVNEGNNESTDIRDSANTALFNWFQMSLNLTNGYSELRYDNVNYTAALADALEDAIGASGLVKVGNNINAPAIGDVVINHVTGTPFPPGSASNFAEGWLVIE